MKTRKLICIVQGTFLFVSALPAEKMDIEAAAQPINAGMPQVAIIRLREFLGGNITPEESRIARGKLGEALLAAGETEEALKVLQNPDLLLLPATEFNLAQTYATLGRWGEAFASYQKVASDSHSPFRSRAILGQAEALRALQRTDEALQLLMSLFSDPKAKDQAELRSVELLLRKRDITGARRVLDKTRPQAAADKKEKRFLRGQLEAQLGHYERALELFQTILRKPEGASRAVFIATLCAAAETSLRLNRPETGDDALEDFIEHHPTAAELPTIFKTLDQLYRAEPIMSNQELRRWANDSIQPRRALAQWYFAKSELRAGRRESALRVFAELRGNNPKFSDLAEGLLEFAHLELEDRRFSDALAIAEDARALGPSPTLLERINFLTGQAQYGLRHFPDAAETFETVANTSTDLAADSFYNASLSWLQSGDHVRFLADYQKLDQAGENEEARGDLLIEEGLVQATQGNKLAAETLQGFLREFPRHKRIAEAWVALAELAFHSIPANLDAARKNLARAAQSGPNDVARERADYLAIWLEDAAPNAVATNVIDAANRFLRTYPTSPLVSDVRMKLAEAYYRQQDFPNAQTQFQILAQENPQSGFTEKALFFAAKSAMQSMGMQSLDRALLLLDEVVKKGGDLKWAARNEQAAIERRLGKQADATTLYDEVLQGNAKLEEKRAALCGKGDILYELGSTDRENYKRAIDLYGQLASQKDVPLHWRNQALFKKGTCLEKLGDRENSLATFYEIIEDENLFGRQREFFWYYKAGFNAARLLEDDAKWQPAAVIYQKLASAGGARSEEAKARLSQLRLEHFLWDQ